MEWADRGNVEPDAIRLADIKVFVTLYKKAGEDGFENLQDILPPGSNLSTVRVQLARVVGAFCGPTTPGHAFKLLFARPSKSKPAKPTPTADELYKWLEMIDGICSRAREGVQAIARGGQAPVTLRIGSAQTFGLYLVPYMLSRWEDVFKDHVQLGVEVANSKKLIDRLCAGGVLDCVIAFGPPHGTSVDFGLPMKFEPLKKGEGQWLESSTVLLRHPEGSIWMKNRADPIRDFQEDPQKRRKKQRAQAVLPPINVDEIDFERTRLIAVTSWYQPPRLKEVVERARDEHKRFLEVDTFDEAVAHVRMNQGVCFVPEAFKRRRDVTAFMLTPEADYLRSIGVYYRAEPKLALEPPPAVRLLIDFMNMYLGYCGDKVLSDGAPPGFNDADYRKGCEAFKKTANWSLLQRR